MICEREGLEEVGDLRGGSGRAWWTGAVINHYAVNPDTDVGRRGSMVSDRYFARANSFTLRPSLLGKPTSLRRDHFEVAKRPKGPLCRAWYIFRNNPNEIHRSAHHPTDAPTYSSNPTTSCNTASTAFPWFRGSFATPCHTSPCLGSLTTHLPTTSSLFASVPCCIRNL